MMCNIGGTINEQSSLVKFVIVDPMRVGRLDAYQDTNYFALCCDSLSSKQTEAHKTGVVRRLETGESRVLDAGKHTEI